MIRQLTFLALPIVIMLVSVACAERAEHEPASEPESQVTTAFPKAEIAWFEGSVEDAFSAAAMQNKPVFLYWGAEWCPPCHELKATIFQRPEFIRQSRLFLPVYLDGDSERAQLYGEQFGVFGYPTVIIFNPEGQEITRIPGGMNIEQYVGVLDLALNAMRPVSELVDAVRNGQALSDADWNLLANYSWGQDQGRVLGDGDLFSTARLLAQACPADQPVARSQLQMLALTTWLRDEGRDLAMAGELSSSLQTVLADDALTEANLTAFLFNSGRMIELLSAEGEERTHLAQQLEALNLATYQASSTTTLIRLEALFGWLDCQLALLPEDSSLPEDKQQWLFTEVEKTRQQLNSYQQHAAVNIIGQLYFQAGMVEQSREILAYGMEVSKQPYYFMSSMGFIERELGNNEEALIWFRKAWDHSNGAATRVQWGTNYLMALVKLSPDDLESIDLAGEAVLAELGAQQAGLHHRSAARMGRLSASLLEWSEDEPQRQQVLEKLRAQMNGICAAQSVEQPETCDSFLQPPQAA